MKQDKFDGFHNFIVIDELSRCASGGVLYGIAGGYGIGLPPIIHFGSDYLKKMILPGCLRGDDRICLAITEPSGGKLCHSRLGCVILCSNRKWL
jgi:alkylation response protein AidB-like acyl-CoA dehydrogenase